MIVKKRYLIGLENYAILYKPHTFCSSILITTLGLPIFNNYVHFFIIDCVFKDFYLESVLQLFTICCPAFETKSIFSLDNLFYLYFLKTTFITLFIQYDSVVQDFKAVIFAIIFLIISSSICTRCGHVVRDYVWEAKKQE